MVPPLTAGSAWRPASSTYVSAAIRAVVWFLRESSSLDITGPFAFVSPFLPQKILKKHVL